MVGLDLCSTRNLGFKLSGIHPKSKIFSLADGVLVPPLAHPQAATSLATEATAARKNSY